MNGVKCIIKKELKRVTSDRKLIFSLFILPAILMMGIMGLSTQLSKVKSDDISEHIPIVYIQNEPVGFTQYVEENNIKADIIQVDESMDIEAIKQDIIDGEVELLYIFDPDFLSKINAYETTDSVPVVEEFYNSSADYSSAAYDAFRTITEQMKQSILVKRFGNQQVLTPFIVETNEILDAEKATGQILGQFIPYIVSILMFASAMGLAIDSIAGEKERGTLASMLLTPVKRRDIALGKLISLIALSGISAMIYIIVMIISFPVVFSGFDMSGFSIHLSVLQIVELSTLLLGMVFLYIALICFAAVMAKDVKTASSYISPVYILVMVVGLISLLGGDQSPEFFKFCIPLYGNSLAIQNIMINNLSLGEFAANLGITLAMAALLLTGITKCFNSERIMFNA